VVLAGHVTDPCHGLVALHRGEVGLLDRRPAAAVVEVVEAEPVDPHVGQQVDDALQVRDVVRRDGVPQAGFQPGVEAGLDPADGGVERALPAAELVVSIGQAVARGVQATEQLAHGDHDDPSSGSAVYLATSSAETSHSRATAPRGSSTVSSSVPSVIARQ
jgi:hypothetical protein